MRKIGAAFFLIFFFAFSVNSALAMIGPSVSLTGAAVFGETQGGAAALRFRFLDPDTSDVIKDPDSIDYIAQGKETGVNDPLTWSPPALQSPTIITVENSPDTAGNIRVTKSAYPYTSPTVSENANTTTTTIALSATEDAQIYFPCDEIITTARILVTNGRQLNIIGGSLKGNAPADAIVRGVLRVAGQQMGVYLEGVLIDADNQLGLDAFEFGATTGISPYRFGNVTVQNVHTKNISLATQPYHADCIQPYGATRNVRIDKFTGYGQKQCVFFDPQHIHAGFDMRRMDVDYQDPTVPEEETGYIWFLHFGAPDSLLDRMRPPMGMEKIYAGRRETFYSVPEDGWWSRFSIYPRQDVDAFGWVTDIAEPNSTSATLSASFPEVSGTVFKGASPTGNFVPEESVGLNYVAGPYVNN